MARVIKKTPQSRETISLDWNTLSIPALVYDPHRNEPHKNEAFIKQFGVAHLVNEEHEGEDNVIPLRSKQFSNRMLRHPGFYEDIELKTSDGLTHVDLEIVPLTDTRKRILVLVRDNSLKKSLERDLIQKHIELKKIQTTLIQSAKMASLGELSSGIAHELNQPLQAILGFSQEMEALIPPGSPASDFAKEIVNAGKKMGEIIKSLRTFARSSQEEVVEFALASTVQEAIKMTRHALLQCDVDIDWIPPKEEIFFHANPIQIEQIFVNLITNGKDAIAETGRRGLIKIRLDRDSEGVPVATVEDNGCGMDETTLSKIFDPFFTTKPVGQGTGLGLSITYGIAKKYGIQISVQSKVGKGTQFKLIFNPKEKS